MKMTQLILTASLVVGTTLSVRATSYSDSTGDQGAGNADGIMDITSVEVINTGTDLNFKIKLNGDPTAVNWGKYCIAISTVTAGDTTGDGWARPIGFSANSGMNYWIGSWADGGNGAELYNYVGSWALKSATYASNPDNISFAKDTSSVTLNLSYAGLGLSSGDTFLFDVYTTGGGGGDTAIDALSNPSTTVANWGDNYNSGSLYSAYTITAVPEPSTLALCGISGLVTLIAVRRRR
jgi:hypothetical protein